MEHDFWKDRWRDNKIGFHEGKPNFYLEHHHDVLGARRAVLVPLCGKAEDLAYLAALGHRVVGIELVEDAVRAFFAEHAIEPAIERAGDHAIYRAGALTLIAGDFFTAPLPHPVDALYDRAALVALPAEMRGAYAERVRALVPAGSPGLVLTFEYEPGAIEGPPFSVPEAELRTHYGPPRLLGERADPRGRLGIERAWAVTL